MKSPVCMLLLAAIAATPSLFAQGARVSLPEQREALLNSLTVLLESSPKSPGELPEGRANPFAPVEVQRVESATPEPVRPVSVRLPDDRALVAVARNFHPAGSLIVGDRRVLRLRDGSMLREGDSFTARIQGEPYTVTLRTVEPGGYVLAIGDATIRRGFAGDRRSVPDSAGAPPGGSSEVPPGTEP